ncbi:MAG: SdrD B-like domain-containing protein [Kiritimatiellae bacterium]|nr:SdrD B-like domain-containing protein [Kiritimatiellia bacterium]
MKHLRSSQYRNGCRSVPTACGRVLSRVRRQRDAGVGLVVLVLCGLGAVGAQAQVQSIAGITVTYQTVANTNQNYSTQGGGSSSFPADTTYNIRFNEGSSNHMYLAEVMVGGRTFDSIALAGQINIARSSRAAITGAHHIVLYEQASVSGTNLLLKSSYAATMEESLRSAMINHGADNVFSDQGDGNGNNNNIQRIDYLFPDGLPVHSHIEQRGFLVMDRGGNDRFKIAAVTALDANGKPAGFGPVVSVLETQWGTSGITLDTIVMRGYTEDGDVQHPSASLGSQPLSGVFLSWQALGLKTNDLIYGYALAANDATTNGAYWTQTDNPAYFPINTSPSSTYGGLDLISGGLMFYDEELNVTLGDRAWEDLNANGLQDAGEPGLSNVLVHVYDSVSNLAAVVRTDTNGVWRSPGHGPGAYFATYVCPEGYQFTTRYAGTNSAIDSNADPLTGQTAVYPMSNGQTNLTLDAGFYRLASLGDLTWEDSNVDGQQDIGEPGLGGVVVRLYDAMSNVIATSTSSMVGAYAFNDVRPGTYSVGFTAPAGYQFTAADIGNDATDSDADLATGETVPITLTSGQTNLSVDAGFYQPVSLGDFTWVDTNGNGQQDAGEPGLAGVVVRLYDAASNVTATTTSSVAGAYAFTDLLPGSYSVGFTAPAGYQLTTANAGNDATDSDAHPATGRTGTYALLSGQANTTVDAGFCRPASLGDFTWLDNNFNGQQDAGEPGLPGMVVRLYNAASNVMGTTTSSVAGAYAFSNLLPGTYFVGFTVPVGYQLTTANAGNDATDSDANPATGWTGTYVLTNGQANTTVDAGFYSSGSTGLRLYKSSSVTGNWNLDDTNAYYITIQNTGTVALTGIDLSDLLPGGVSFVEGSAQIVQLLSQTTMPFTETVSDNFGTVSYGNNDGIVNWLGNWIETGDDGSAASGNVLVQSGALVFQDRNARNDTVTRTHRRSTATNRVYTNSVLSFSYRRINWDWNDSMEISVSTNGFAGQSDLVYTVPGESTTDPSFIPITTNITAFMGADLAVRIEAGRRFSNNDQCHFDFITITQSGYDTQNQPQLVYTNGMTVNVISNLPAATPTNVLENYTLPAGTSVTIRIQTTLDVPLVSTQFINVATAQAPTTPPAVAAVTNYAVSHSVGDWVWFDTDGNGIQDSGETGLADVSVRLYSAASNLVAETVSGPNGAYGFSGLPTGAYFLEFVTPSNYLATAQNQGSSEALDSDMDPATGRTAVFTLSGGTNDTSRDAGFYQPSSSLGDFVWRDVNVDGIQSGGSETGMPGVVVRLYDTTSNVVATTATSAAGIYSFTNLAPGTYFLEFVAPSGFTFTLRNRGGNDELDSDVDIATGRTALFYLPPGTHDLSWDAGLTEVISGLSIVKVSDASSCLTPGDTITYTVTVVNTGNVAQAGVAISDVLPPGLTYVTNSAQVISTNTVVNTVLDEFNDVAYDNQDGTRNWSVDWQESDPYGTVGPVGDYVGIVGERLQFYWAYVGSEAAWRWADLSAETNATLSFDWETVGLDANEYLSVQIATNSSGPFVQLVQLGGTASGSTNFNITAYISTTTTIRVEPTPGSSDWERNEYGYLDNIEFSSICSTITTNPAAAPPLMVFDQTLAPEGSLTVSFQATVDVPSTVTQLVNTATIYSAVQPPLEAVITNCVEVADVGVHKVVSDSTPDMLSDIAYTLVASNNGPATATGVVITDVLPPQMQYSSHSNGAYSAATGEWTIGTLAVGASTTLVVSATVNEGTAGHSITNVASVTGRDLFDPVPANDVSAVVILPNPGITIGSRIWFDANGDGIQDANETNGVANIPVALVDTNGNMRATTHTDAQGTYLFEGMLPGTYTVQFDLSALTTNEILSPSKQGDDPTRDSDALAGNTCDLAWTEPLLFNVDRAGDHLHVDLGIATRGTTRAEVVEVWGEWSGDEGRVVWRTDSEFGTAGFFVYRVDPQTGAETRLSPLLLPSAFRESGATYWQADPAARRGEAGTYRLEEKELSGDFRDLGVHDVRFAVAKKATPRSPMRLPTAPARTRQPRAVPRGGATTTSAVQKVLVCEEGVYGVSLQSLAEGMGLPLEAVQALAATNGLVIKTQGAPVPAIYDAAREQIVFYGEAPPPNWYVHDAAYLISAGEGRAMARREPGATGGTPLLPVRLHFEEDVFLFNMNQMPDDFYFWIPVMSGFGPLSINPIPLDLSGYAGGDVTLKVRLMGWSSSPNNPDHLAVFGFNGTEVGSITFDGQEAVEVDLTIPASAVISGENTLTVEGVLQPGYTESFFVVDWVEAAFNRQVAPRAEAAFFRAGGVSAVSAAAFTNPLVLSLDDNGWATWIADENGTLDTKAWAAQADDERFAVIEADAVPLLAPEPAAADAWFLAPTNRIDYLVIASRALAPAAQELAEYRAGQELRTGVAVFEEVCDLMTGGERTPEAIPELLAYAQATWARPPHMVVLVGNGHYDYRGINYAEVNHLPPMMIQTHAGVCAVDGLLADAGGDELPDVAIGRLPARNASDLSAMIAKIKAYETGFGAAWQNELVLVADTADAAGQFPDANTQIEQLVAAPYRVAERIELDETDVETARVQLLNQFQSGAGFIHYTGHGGLHNYSSQNLLKGSDVAAMTNALRSPVTVALSCVVGRFEVPGATSLGEVLMQHASGGAVAVLGPSGLSQHTPATELGEAFYQAILQEGEGRLGLAFLQARRSLSETVFCRDTLSLYNLLGDPALRIAGNPIADMPLDLARVRLQDVDQVYDGTPRCVTAQTDPAGLAVEFTYDGAPTPPTAVGRYAVVATVVDATYEGSASGTLTVEKGTADLTLDDLTQTYDGTPRVVSATTIPAGLALEVTYDGQAMPPTVAGNYAVVAAVADANYEGRASGLLTVEKAAATIVLGEMTQTYDGTPRMVSASTMPAGLPVALSYNGEPVAPTAAGIYVVEAVVNTANREGGQTGLLTVAKAPVAVALANLEQAYDGETKQVTALANAPDVAIAVTYNGGELLPSRIGSYEVVAHVDDPNFTGTAAGTLSILPTRDPFKVWLESKGLNPQEQYDAGNEDIDGDGLTTYQEYIADTHPDDLTSVFELLSDYNAKAGELSLIFFGSSNRIYELLVSTNLFQTTEVIDLGRGQGPMVVTTNVPGSWVGTVRVRMPSP